MTLPDIVLTAYLLPFTCMCCKRNSCIVDLGTKWKNGIMGLCLYNSSLVLSDIRRLWEHILQCWPILFVVFPLHEEIFVDICRPYPALISCAAKSQIICNCLNANCAFYIYLLYTMLSVIRFSSTQDPFDLFGLFSYLDFYVAVLPVVLCSIVLFLASDVSHFPFSLPRSPSSPPPNSLSRNFFLVPLLPFTIPPWIPAPLFYPFHLFSHHVPLLIHPPWTHLCLLFPRLPPPSCW